MTCKLCSDPGRLLMPGEVASILRVDPRTVNRWREAGLLVPVNLPGGGHRYRASDIRAILEPEDEQRQVSE